MINNDDLDILARTLYGEARGEYYRLDGGLSALIAVGNVVMNRLKANNWYGKTIQEICQKPYQFSCWNQDDPNRKTLMQEEILDEVFMACRYVAGGVTSGQWPDLTQGSDHYHTIALPNYPQWANGREPKLQLGQHIFYQLEA